MGNVYHTKEEMIDSVNDFLMDALVDGGVMKRIDLAINDHTGILDIPELAEKCRKREYIGKSRSYKFYQSGELIKHREDDREYMGHDRCCLLLHRRIAGTWGYSTQLTELH